MVLYQFARASQVALCVLTCFSHVRLYDAVDCSPPGSSVHGDSLGKNTGVGCCALLQGIFPTQRLNPRLWEPSRLAAPQPDGSAVKNPTAMQEPQEMQVQSLGQEDPLEEGTATHSSILA